MDVQKLLIVAVLTINAYATIRVVRADLLSTSTKVVQIALVWLAPILGAVICLTFLSSQSLGPATHDGALDSAYGTGAGGGGGHDYSDLGCGGDGGGDGD